jgi:hypothetical protein
MTPPAAPQIPVAPVNPNERNQILDLFGATKP